MNKFVRKSVGFGALIFGFLLGPIGWAQAQTSSGFTAEAARPKRARIPANDLVAWRTAETADNARAYRAYLAAYPNGWFKLVANSRIAAGLTPSLLERRPYSDAVSPTSAEITALRAWEEELWQDAKRVGTNNAMREYLWAVPNGAHGDEASQMYLATWPKLPQGAAPDCAINEFDVKKTANFDIERAYPQRAVDRNLEDIAFGDVLIDRTGAVLSFSNTFYTKPDFFAQSTKRTVMRMRYQPLRAGCLQTMPKSFLVVNFKLEDEEFTEDKRPTPNSVDGILDLEKPNNLQLPDNRRLKVSVPHNNQNAVYSVRTRSSFFAVVEYSCDGKDWSRLINGTHFGAFGPCPILLRISALPSITVGPNGERIDDPPAKGPIEIIVKRQATRQFEE
jgi:hypothetical protein